MTWKKIAESGAVSPGKGKAFEVDGKKIAVFNQDGYHAMDDVVRPPRRLAGPPASWTATS